MEEKNKKINIGFVFYILFTLIVYALYSLVFILFNIGNQIAITIISKINFDSLILGYMSLSILYFGGNLLDKYNTNPEVFKQIVEDLKTNKSIKFSRKVFVAISWTILLFLNFIIIFLYSHKNITLTLDINTVITCYSIIISSFIGVESLKVNAMNAVPKILNDDKKGQLND